MVNTLDEIKMRAAEIMASGGPKTKDEILIVKLATPSGKAFNAGQLKVKKTGSGK